MELKENLMIPMAFTLHILLLVVLLLPLNTQSLLAQMDSPEVQADFQNFIQRMNDPAGEPDPPSSRNKDPRIEKTVDGEELTETEYEEFLQWKEKYKDHDGPWPEPPPHILKQILKEQNKRGTPPILNPPPPIGLDAPFTPVPKNTDPD